MDFIGRLAAKGFVRPVLIVPIDSEFHFPLEVSLVFGDCDQPQDLFHSSVESFHHGDATALSNRSESGQDVLGFAPDVLEVLAFELACLVDDQVFGAYLLNIHDLIQRGSHFLRRRSAFEDGESNGAS